MKFKKTYLLYILCLVVLLFNNYELTFVVWSFTALITLRTNFSKHFIYIISCFRVLYSQILYSLSRKKT